MLTVVVYETDGLAAKATAKEHATPNARAMALHVEAWDGQTPRADKVIFMSDVQDWKRAALEAKTGAMAETVPAPDRLPETTEDSFRHAMTSQITTVQPARTPKKKKEAAE